MRSSALFLLTLSVLLPDTARALEEPEYTLLASANGIEFRRYAPYLVVETPVADGRGRSAAANTGFRRLFRYISGDNAQDQKIAMTAPVQQQQHTDHWRVAFVVPARFDAASTPQPSRADVQVKTTPERTMAVLRFSGRWSDANVTKHTKLLTTGLTALGVESQGAAIIAFYNAPFVPSFLRRNEVMLHVRKVPDGLSNSSGR